MFSKKCAVVKDKVLKDKYGNSFSIEREGDKFVKVTQTDRYSKFEFLGDRYSYDILEQNTTLKTYVDERHCQHKYPAPYTSFRNLKQLNFEPINH